MAIRVTQTTYLCDWWSQKLYFASQAQERASTGTLKGKVVNYVGGNFVGESEVEWQRGQKKWYEKAIPSDACFQDLSFLRLRGKLQYGLKSSF